LKLLIDKNLSPQLAAWANEQGLEASAAIYRSAGTNPDRGATYFQYLAAS
jgi:predicted nuclease of predicted toxin-antitoxin system